MKLFLSHAGLSEVAGGVERYAHYLSTVFPDLLKLDYHSLQNELGDSKFFPLKEPLRAKKLGEYVSKNYSNVETVFTNGMFCWNLPQKAQINICHGSYAAFAEKAVSKTNPDYYRLKYLYNFFERKSAQNSLKIVSNSKQTSLNVQKFFDLDSKIIYPPVDTELFKPLNLEKSKEKLDWSGVNVLFVGRPEYAKGFDLVEKLASKFSEINFKCILSRPYISKLKNLEVIMKKKHSELPLYYNSSDLIVFPSRFEGFGFVTVEALACNKKVVALNTGVSSEINSENLFLCEENALESVFLNAIKSEEKDSMGLVKKLFSVDAFSKQWKALVNEL
ncbi:MAG TPA: glycosyltransferase [archaeon]|nr:glycosyltransferase [archaeon]